MLNLIANSSVLLTILLSLTSFSGCQAADDAFTAPDKVDAPGLLGVDNHPSLDDIYQIYTKGAAFHMGYEEDTEYLNTLNLVLVALTKCNRDWIKSSVQEANDDDKSATIVIAKEDEQQHLAWDAIEVKFDDLEHVYKVISKDSLDDIPFDHWWPWAFAEATLKAAADSGKPADYFRPATILSFVSGHVTVAKDMVADDLAHNKDSKWKEYFDKIDSSPILIGSTHDAVELRLYVAMTAHGEGDARVVECLRLSPDSGELGAVMTELKYADFHDQLKEIYYLDKHASFDGRARLPRA